MQVVKMKGNIWNKEHTCNRKIKEAIKEVYKIRVKEVMDRIMKSIPNTAELDNKNEQE